MNGLADMGSEGFAEKLLSEDPISLPSLRVRPHEESYSPSAGSW
jgi:hypothetical protein